MPWEWCVRNLLILLFALATGGVFAQDKSLKPANTIKPEKANVQEKPKLTPAQERGWRLLKAAEANAGGLTPDMRAVVLWQASQAYDRTNPERRIALLKDAYRAAVSIPDDNLDVPCFLKPDECHAKPWTERQILPLLLSLSPNDTDELLVQAEPDVRHDMTALLISRAVDKQQFDRAEELLRKIAHEKGFPYDPASELMTALPATRAADRATLFALATSNFETFGKDELMRPEDLGTLIIRFAKDLPRPTVVEAIDLVLKRAKDVDEGDNDPHVMLSSQKGSVSLSYYDYRLFQLLPTLQEIDSSRAEDLLKEHQEAAAALKQYPSGLATLDPTLRDTPLTKEEKMRHDFVSMTMRDNPTPSEKVEDQAVDRWNDDVEAKVNAVNEQVRSDPKQALAIAMTLPLWGLSGPGPNAFSPRANTLANVAVATSKRDPEVAQKAIDEIQGIADQVKPQFGGRLLTRIAETELNMAEPERAEKALKQAMKIAQKLYESDIDSSDPNLAMKAQWPSAGLWRKVVMLGARISPDFGEQLMAEIADPEIRVLQEIAMANALLGSSEYPFRFIEWRKSGNHLGMAVF